MSNLSMARKRQNVFKSSAWFFCYLAFIEIAHVLLFAFNATNIGKKTIIFK